MDHTYNLTKMASKGGCAAKIDPQTLSKVLANLPGMPDEMADNLLVGFDKNDDACVIKINDDLAIAQTVDFFPPVVDDPYIFGQIAATNALSDIYAMGGTPLMAVNLLTFPCGMDEECIAKILKGGYDTAVSAGVAVGGGHTIDDKEPKYGMAVTGMVNPNEIWKNSTAQPGDVIVITKKIGVGIYSVASRGEELSEADEDIMIKQMTTLNKHAAELAAKYEVHACTDVTGFGLIGHALEMAKGSNVSIRLYVDKIPFLDRAVELAKQGFVPAGAYGNRRLIDNQVDIEEIDEAYVDCMLDPQTSGGLMLSMSEAEATDYVKDMAQEGQQCYIIGRVNNKEQYPLFVLSTNA